ncbi:MAG: hypothetical protein JSV41_01770, partial [Gemmatimonadota bacterium]
MPRRADPDLFTESAFLHLAKTTWARLTTPRAITTYRATFRQLFALLRLTCHLLVEVTVELARYVWELSLWAAGIGREFLARAEEVRNSRRIADSRTRWRHDPHRQVAARTQRAGGARRPTGIPGPRQPQGSGRPTARPRPVSHTRAQVVARVRQALPEHSLHVRPLGELAGAALGAAWSRALRLGARIRRVASMCVELDWAWGTWLRRYRFACLSLFQSVVLLLAGPVLVDILAALSTGAASRVTSLSPPAAPRVELPRFAVPTVTIRKPALPEFSLPDLPVPRFSKPRLIVPELSLQLPGFIVEPVRKLDAMLAGPLIDAGSRIVVADVAISSAGEDGLGVVLALLIEAELAQAERFAVVPRERTLAARGASGFGLTITQALELAPATGAAAVLAGELVVKDGIQRLALTVVDPMGEEQYRVEVELVETEMLEALGGSLRQLRGRLGAASEPKHATSVLSPSLQALRAYARARAHLHRGRYRRAIVAAIEAVRHDSAFASAHRVLAEAYALAGERSRARASLETAWRYRGRLSERERLRVAADRQALAGRYSQAILAYDRLFSRYRDDVGALKSQAILQTMIGARGGGLGNLQVAYS